MNTEQDGLHIFSPFLFFIEICNKEEGNRKEYFGFHFKGDSTAVFGWVRCARMVTWTVSGERTKRSFLDMSVLSLDRDQEERRDHNLSIFQSVKY